MPFSGAAGAAGVPAGVLAVGAGTPLGAGATVPAGWRAWVRPLIASDPSRSTKALVRDHEVEWDAQSGLLSLLGGKWTTYRKMAEDVIDQAERVAGLGHKPSPTGALAIHGAGGEISPDQSLKFYGADGAGITKLMATDPALAAPVQARLALRPAEVVWHTRYEMARTVEDVLARRTRSLVLSR